MDRIIKEKISADHLLYVSLKYTKTSEVILNLILRWTIMIEYSFENFLKFMSIIFKTKQYILLKS